MANKTMALRMRVTFLLLLLALAARPAFPAAAPAEVLAGIDVLEQNGYRELKDKSVGLITNQTGVDRRGRTTVTVLANAPGVELKALFSPEHGFAGTLEQESIESGMYILPGGRKIPLYSLYGSTRAPTADMLKGLDALVFDIQDIGARFYTYSTTMAMALEAAKKANIEFFVLDRPNPIGGTAVEGAVLDPSIRHFIAYMPVPVRHGMTMGELARIFNFHARLGAKLQVVALKGWRRDMWHDATDLRWVRPSPNMPDLDSAALYPGTGCFEASNLSVGRGTPVPFRWLGAPWLKPKRVLKRLKKARLKGVTFKAQTFTPEKSVYAGRKTRGIRIVVNDRNAVEPLAVFAHLVTALRDTHPKKFKLKPKRMTLMTGTPAFNKLYESGAGAADIRKFFATEARRFTNERAAFLLY